MTIRELNPMDLPVLAELVREAHSKCFYKDLKLDSNVLRSTLYELIRKSSCFSWGAYDDDKLVGALLAVKSYAPGTLQQVMTDVFFYAREPGCGRALLDAYVDWGFSFPRTRAVGISSSFSDDDEYNGKMHDYMKRAGFNHIGGIYMRMKTKGGSNE